MSPPPSKQEVAVATETLRTEANMWLRHSDQMEVIAGKAQGLRMTRLEAGIFQLLVSPYDEVADQITARCREGQQRMADIAATLRQVADTYDAEDASNAHKLQNLY
ncbi:hypothetical protein SAMN05444365_104438 [Micromonospora pattaloongensis]|uniref:Excreted virulence factor EspC, type VII ESX diderm n=1 Tax=Micromonospora pattaloongensis TaxID=405436 RepID=A0A1H3PCJ4_9ACTN|nr:hypothetical protein [Micromonospora pattaloongensis]SDY98525.1 hypothetical protein SAMN05444365_104438 [Micromonospora pattaloongensis]